MNGKGPGPKSTVVWKAPVVLTLFLGLLLALPSVGTAAPAGAAPRTEGSAPAILQPSLTPISSGSWSFNTSDSAAISLVAVSGDPGYVAAGSTSGHVYLFNISSNQPLGVFALPAAPTTLTVSARGPAPGTNSLVLTSVGAEVYALNLTQPGSFLQAWNFTDNLAYFGKGITNQQVVAVAVDAESSDVAVLSSFLQNGLAGVALAYLVHGKMTWHYTALGGVTPAGMGVAMTPDGSLVALTVNLQGRTSEATIFPYFGSPTLNYSWPNPGATATATALSADGTHVFLGGNTGFNVGKTAVTGQSYGATTGSTFDGVSQIATGPSGAEFMVETTRGLYAFNALAMSGSPGGAYTTPVWSLTLSSPLPQVLLSTDDPAYFALLGAGTIGSTLRYYYTPFENLSSGPAAPYRTVQLPSTSLSAASSNDLAVVAVGMQHVAGQALPELMVVLDAGAPSPPGFVVYVYGVTPSSFTVAWNLAGSSVQGFVSYAVQLYPRPAMGGWVTLTDPALTTTTFTGLSPGTTYNVSVTLRSFFGLYQEVAVGSGTTFPAPPPPDPFFLAEIVGVALLVVGAAVAGALLFRSGREPPPPPDVEESPRLGRQERGWGARGRPRGGTSRGRRTRRSSRLPPGFG
ncbi:MAG: fibronectin type III domain-containing protein [Euryarchaeota archaeon]|nr:fibronectin type III domain-containing protein [Euryarchaeota archaeon]